MVTPFYIILAVYMYEARSQGAIDDVKKTIDCQKISGSAGITVELCAGLRDKPGELSRISLNILELS